MSYLRKLLRQLKHVRSVCVDRMARIIYRRQTHTLETRQRLVEAGNSILGVSLEECQRLFQGVQTQGCSLEFSGPPANFVGLDGVELQLQTFDLEVFDLHAMEMVRLVLI